MESFLDQAANVGAWAGAILWVLLLAVSCLAILLSLPGGWVALGLAVLYDALHGFDAIGTIQVGTSP